MRRFAMVLTILVLLAVPAAGAEYTAPEAPAEALELMGTQSGSFAQDLWTVINGAAKVITPEIAAAAKACFCVFAAVVLCSLLRHLPGHSASIAEFAGILAVSALLLESVSNMVTQAGEAITQMSAYAKLLLPVLTTALASQGAITSATALYAGTAAFNAVLCSVVSNVMIPMVYVVICLSVAAGATGESTLEKLRDLCKWLMTGALKTVLYIFTGYMGITGVVSGTTDAATLKAAKLTVAGVVPVVGGILSDASEAVVVSAGVMKNAVGVYGVTAILAIWILPFMRIGIQYLLLKLTAALGAVFESKAVTSVVENFASAMGLLLAMTGSVCVLLLVSIVCFMKGVSV